MIFPVTYFPPIIFWSLWQQGEIILEAKEHYQKRSFRNRMHIASPNGWLALSIPLLKGKNSKMPVQDVLIDNTKPWQRDHWRSLQTAYGKSPFFEHYMEALRPLYVQKYEKLFDFNMSTILLVRTLLFADNQSFILSDKYEYHNPKEDFRGKIKPNQEFNHSFVEYVQVFQDQTGFVSNLSILDLLFCMGPEAARFL